MTGALAFRFGPAAAFAILLALPGCAPQSPPPVSAGPIPPGEARLWFYRDYEPSVSRNFATVALNGSVIGQVRPEGGGFYRDVPPGHYHISVESFGTDTNQAKDIDLAPGQEAFAKVLASTSWASSGDVTSFQRDTFYIALIPPQQARTEMAAYSL